MAVPYLELAVSLSPIEPWRELMIAQLGTLGFEGFFHTPRGFNAYLPEADFDKNSLMSLPVFDATGLEVSWRSKIIPPQNWNATWEKNFSPIRVGGRCVVRAHFHPQENAEYELVITPKMSFGTGHHSTTQMMISFLLDFDLRGKTVLDMGTGTGVLAILAEKRGGKKVLALDNDPWCVENTQENTALNNCKNILARLGEKVPRAKKFDLVLANINRNVLLEQIRDYAEVLIDGGSLLMSGFYVDDLALIQRECERVGFDFICNFEQNQWVATHFLKV
jgi:ribosomal protein L11 methyltransferase